MRRAFLSTCVHSYGVCTQAYRFPADFPQSCAAPMLAAHTQASGVNPVRNATAHGPSSTQKGFDSQSAGSKGKRTSRWRIVDSSDLRSVNQSNGKLEQFSASQLIPALAAKQWPEMSVSSHAQADEDFSKPLAGTNARIVLASYRASAEMYLSEWRNVITESFQDHAAVELVELNVCDLATPVQHSVVGVRIGIVTEKGSRTSLPDVFAQLIAMQICKVWPFKGMLLNASKAQSKPRTALSKMSTRRVHYFGDEKVAVDGLGMSNRLTGYVFVVDEDGRVRWQASGRMLEEEAHSFLRAVRGLLGAHTRDAGTDSEYGDTDGF